MQALIGGPSKPLCQLSGGRWYKFHSYSERPGGTFRIRTDIFKRIQNARLSHHVAAKEEVAEWGCAASSRPFQEKPRQSCYSEENDTRWRIRSTGKKGGIKSVLWKSEKSLQGEKSESQATFSLKAKFCHLSALLKGGSCFSRSKPAKQVFTFSENDHRTQSHSTTITKAQRKKILENNMTLVGHYFKCLIISFCNCSLENQA